ncbi:MAG: methyltransferase domain-containing protein [Burkholderiaceae bacterium]
MTGTGFYRAFEDCYRGSRELIAGRLAVYRPFIQALKAAFPQASGADLGCGRGEWLELLAAEGLAGQGIDLDEDMLADCRERGLTVERGDALAWLRAQPDESFALVSAFHLVEHLPFETLQALIVEALRVLRPGGLLVMETPNPENLVVGTESFYLDPTHTRPLPAALLSFLARFHGFERVQVLRLQHDPALMSAPVLGLRQVIEGVSPDYSVLARKGGPQAVVDALDAAFAIEDGISRAALADRYDRLLAERLEGVEGGMSGPVGRALDERVTAIEAARTAEAGRHEAMQARIVALEASAQASAEVAASLANRLEAVYASRSWRITGPLRGLATLLRRLVGKD